MEAIGDKLEFFSAKNDFPFNDLLHCTVDQRLTRLALTHEILGSNPGSALNNVFFFFFFFQNWLG